MIWRIRVVLRAFHNNIKEYIFLFFVLFSYSFCSVLDLEKIFISSQSDYYSINKWKVIKNKQRFLSSSFLPIKITKADSVSTVYYLKYNENSVSYMLQPCFKTSNEIFYQAELFGSIVIPLSDLLYIQNDFLIDSNNSDNKHFKGSIRDAVSPWSAYIQHSSLSYFYGNSSFIMLGRSNIGFSELGNNLLLNTNFHPVELMWWSHNNKKINYNWLSIFLDRVDCSKEKSKCYPNRIFHAHRYSYKGNSFSFGITEAAIFSYENLESNLFGYLLPSGVVFETEVNRGNNSNMFLLFDLKYYKGNTSFWMEYLIDDVAIDGKSPNKTGILAAISKRYGDQSVSIEYARIKRWVGSYNNLDQRLIVDSIAMMDPFKPDFFQIELNYFIEKQTINNLYVFSDIGFIYNNSGSGTIDEWPVGIGTGENFGFTSSQNIMGIFPNPTWPQSKNIIFSMSLGLGYKNFILNVLCEGHEKKCNGNGLQCAVFSFEESITIPIRLSLKYNI